MYITSVDEVMIYIWWIHIVFETIKQEKYDALSLLGIELEKFKVFVNIDLKPWE